MGEYADIIREFKANQERWQSEILALAWAQGTPWRKAWKRFAKHSRAKVTALEKENARLRDLVEFKE